MIVGIDLGGTKTRIVAASDDDVVYDAFTEAAFPDQPIGRPIIGRPETIQSFDEAGIRAYLAREYTPDRVVVAAVIQPPVVLVGPTTDSQVNVDDVELEDKLAIFSAAIGEQLDALKSVRDETPSGV